MQFDIASAFLCWASLVWVKEGKRGEDLLLHNMETLGVSFHIVWWGPLSCILDIHGVGGGFGLSSY